MSRASRSSREAIRQQIAFYGSTPAYRPVLELHGWGELQGELNRMSKQGQWVEMGEQVDEDVLDAFCVTAEPARMADAIKARYGGAIDRTMAGFAIADPDQLAEQIAKLQES